MLSLKELVDNRLFELIPESNLLFAPAQYALEGGKRLRPLLALVTAESYGLAPEKALNAACALEFIHTYSLIHDDLPCMDDDDERRGKPSLHRAFTEGQAVLTGDFLLTYAFELIAHSPPLVLELAKSAGSEGMIGGQVIDIETQGEALSEDTLLIIQTKKTAALMACSLVFGGIVAGAPSDDIAVLRSLGISLGIAFQFNDDRTDGKGASLYLSQERVEALRDLYLNRALNELTNLSGNTQNLQSFMSTIFYEPIRKI